MYRIRPCPVRAMAVSLHGADNADRHCSLSVIGANAGTAGHSSNPGSNTDDLLRLELVVNLAPSAGTPRQDDRTCANACPGGCPPECGVYVALYRRWVPSRPLLDCVDD